MITLKVAELIMPKFKHALLALMKQEMGFDTAFRIKSLIKKIEDKIIEVEEVKFSLIKKYCQTDENGNLIEAKDEAGKVIKGSVVPLEETVDEFKAKFAEYLSTKIEFDVPKINVEKLRDTRVTIEDLHFLEPFLDDKPNLTLV